MTRYLTITPRLLYYNNERGVPFCKTSLSVPLLEHEELQSVVLQTLLLHLY